MDSFTVFAGNPQKMETATCVLVTTSPIPSGLNFSAASTAQQSGTRIAIKRNKTNSMVSGGATQELLRCKRRIQLSQLGCSSPQARPATVSRRNERERNRVKLVNLGFDTLKQHVPNGTKNKKMSKVETLRAAVLYIKQLQELLTEQENTNSVLGENILTYNMQKNQNCYPESVSASNSKDSVHNTVMPPYTSSQTETQPPSSPTSSLGSDAASPQQSLGYDESSPRDILNPEDEDLLDFTSWFS
ncbi:achaete-scute homolog 1-like [Limulus polyphemus]|uniref:Achaete-scute homolog 1-like n=1 Tax=Limulus polyphemus TaxID=6850 RepID=A0ABM1B0G2_LIMPO|nr:achaete-scute homolog 1-like [Limulus polyphemus]